MINENSKKAECILKIYEKFGQMGVWCYDKVTKDIEVSEEWAAMLGYTIEELKPLNEELFFSLIHPDDVELVSKRSEQLYNGEVDVFECEFRLRHKEGYYIWILSKGEAFSCQGASPRVFAGIHINIDKQKRALQKVIKQNHGIVSAFSKVVEYKDEYTRNHMDNVAELAVSIGIQLGMESEDFNNLWVSGKVHDLGKLKLPIDVLNKPGKLTPKEYDLVKTHSSVGYELLKSFDFGFPLAEIVQQHHERLDGSGYPLGLKGDEIDYKAQIIAVADIADAMLSNRPYRHAMPKKKVIEILESYKDIYYNSEIIEACIKVLKQSVKY